MTADALSVGSYQLPKTPQLGAGPQEPSPSMLASSCLGLCMVPPPVRVLICGGIVMFVKYPFSADVPCLWLL